VSFKPNSTNMLVQNMWCNGSHGISVGSLGQYKGEFDIVENIYVFNASMHNTTVSLISFNRTNKFLQFERTVLASKSGPTLPRPCPVISKAAVVPAWSRTSPTTP